MNEFNKDFETGIAYIYGRPSPYKSKSIYGYLRNNNYTSKQSDVVILVKDNDFKYFCIMIKYYKILWSDMQILTTTQCFKQTKWVHDQQKFKQPKMRRSKQSGVHWKQENKLRR